MKTVFDPRRVRDGPREWPPAQRTRDRRPYASYWALEVTTCPAR